MKERERERERERESVQMTKEKQGRRKRIRGMVKGRNYGASHLIPTIKSGDTITFVRAVLTG